MMKRDYIPGSTVWVVERDDFNVPVDVSGYMFLTCADNYAIVTPFLSGLEDNVSGTLRELAEDCRFNGRATLCVFPLYDCYYTQESAEAEMQKEWEAINSGKMVHLDPFEEPQPIAEPVQTVVETHHNCTVQILRNTETGKQSIGWWPEEQPPMVVLSEEE